MSDPKGSHLYVNLSAPQTRRHLKGFGHGVRKIQSAGKDQAVIIHTATGRHLEERASMFADVGFSAALFSESGALSSASMPQPAPWTLLRRLRSSTERLRRKAVPFYQAERPLNSSEGSTELKVMHAAVGFAVLVTSLFVASPVLSSDRPNIVVIVADDLGFSDVGCYGGDIPTPHIDSLARDGIRFSQFYDCAVCVPTRASLLTGLYPHQCGRALPGEPGWTDAGIATADDGLPPHTGHYRAEAYGRSEPGVPGGLSLDCPTLADVLAQSGYRTLMSGKWHCGEAVHYWPVNRGFDRYFGLLEGAANYFNPKKDYLRPRTLMLDKAVYDVPEKSFYMTDAISEYAVRFLDEYADDERPFFLYLPYTAPHAPLQAWPEDIEKFRGHFAEGWDVLRRRRYQRLIDEGIINSTCALSPRDDAVNAWRLAKLLHQTEKLERKMEVYAAQVESMDTGIGRVLERLKKHGVEENTIVLFLSDNGAYGGELDSDLGELDSTLPPGGENAYESYGRGWANLGSTPFRLYKTWLHEGGIAAPLIIRWPAQVTSGNAVRRNVSHVMDLYPTLLELAGGSYPAAWNGKPTSPLAGHSLVPVLTSDGEAQPRTLFWENFGHRAVRSGDWKLVAKHRRWELYNMKTDRSEMHDLAGSRPVKVRELATLYDQWARRVGAGVPPAVARK